MGNAGTSRADRVVPGVRAVTELLASTHRVAEVLVADGRRDLADLADQAGVKVREATKDELDRLTDGVAHQGVVALAAAFPYVGIKDLIDADHAEPAFLVALDGVTDPRNFGAVARTAEGVGAHGLIIPRRRSAAVGPAAEKAAAGALSHLPVARVPNLVRALDELGAAGIWRVALDAGADEEVHSCQLLTEPVVLILGSEGQGLARLTQVHSDLRVSLQMRGRVPSLNVSAAAAIALYAVRLQREPRRGIAR